MTRPSLSAERVAVLTQQVSNYHAARYRAAQKEFGELRVYSWLNSADFAEFLGIADELSIIRIFEGQRQYRNAIRSGALWRRVHTELDSYGPDVVVVAGWSCPESVSAIAWARTSGRRVVLMSASQFHDARRTPWREAIKRRIVSACDTALVAAERHGAYVTRLGIPPDRVFLGYDAVDNDYFLSGAAMARERAEEVRRAHTLPARYLLASGRFVRKKNFPRLIEAFAASLGSQDHGHCLVILGDGPERPAIERAIRRHGMQNRVQLPGFRPYGVLPQFYGLADGFVHVPIADQWGLVVNEAAAAGLPLVVSHQCGAAETLVEPGRNGYRVEPTDVTGLAAMLQAVMSLSEAERRRMAMVSQQIVSNWGPARHAQGLRAACETALACPRRALRVADRVLLRLLSRVEIKTVQ